MEKDRLLAFSDGVIAIIITIMVLELRPPHEPTLAALAGLAPTFLSYVLSFVYIAIYWNNHHHMLYATKAVNGAILWANMALLFCLSLASFTTAWMGDTAGATLPTAIYGASLIPPAFAYLILQTLIIRADGPDSLLARHRLGLEGQALAPSLRRRRRSRLRQPAHLMAALRRRRRDLARAGQKNRARPHHQLKYGPPAPPPALRILCAFAVSAVSSLCRRGFLSHSGTADSQRSSSAIR